MDGFYGHSMGSGGYDEAQRNMDSQGDVSMGNMDRGSMHGNKGFNTSQLRNNMSDGGDSATGNGVQQGGASQAGQGNGGGNMSTSGSNMAQYAALLNNNSLNNFQFNAHNAMAPDIMQAFNQSQQGSQSQPHSPQQQQLHQQQQNNIMSQMMFQNAYANMLQNQSVAMRMNPNLAQQANIDFSDPNVMSLMKNNLESLNLMSQNISQNPFMNNMATESLLQAVQNNNTGRDQGHGSGAASPNNSRRGSTINRPTPLNTSNTGHLSGSQSQQNSPILVPSRRESTTGQAGSHVASAQNTPTQQHSFSDTIVQPEGPLQPALGYGQGPLTNNFNSAAALMGNANPFPSAVKLNQTSYKDAYSSTGFDMLTVLMRVATRPDPTINIGAVDLSCAFVVCDARQHDVPIVYCSDNFERLTGYTKHEILGRNCRFLQAPNGHVSAGVKRKYVDDETVLHLKNTITTRKEAQVSLINYRKGGQPFMNLLTTIPVSYDGSGDVQFFVGFQVDLVEQPHSVTSRNSDGTYTVNYQRGLSMPRYVFTEKDQPTALPNSGQTISRDEVSTVLATVGSGDSELSKRIWDKVLLENSDDVIFVLSLKGLFLYLSPSSSNVLEYDPAELTSTALSSVCHPSDIVPVTRELKDTTNGANVSVVFRIRRKINGYMWFEGHGSLYTEQGKGRKSIVLVGRERPVYTIQQPDISASGGIGDNEVWTKLSTSGMFLFVSSSIRSLIDKQPQELIGTSIQSLMRPDSRVEFGRILEVARSGRRAQTRHELLNRRGQVLQAYSTLYPGDASEGAKPTFFIAQTRLLKYTRPPTTTTAAPAKSTSGSQVDSNVSKTPRAGGGDQANHRPNPSRAASSIGSANTPNHYLSTFDTISTHAGQDSLPLGDQGEALAHELNLFDELKTTRSTSWQFELRQMERHNRILAEELQRLLAARKKRKRRKGAGVLEKECANCHTKQTPEWRRGPSGNRDLCNSCGLRWAKQQGRISPRTSGHRSSKSAASAKSGKSGKSSEGARSPLKGPSGAGGQNRHASGSADSGGGERSVRGMSGQGSQGRVGSVGSGPPTEVAKAGSAGAASGEVKAEGGEE